MLQAGIGEGQKVQLDIEKNYSGMMMLVIVLMRNVNYKRSGNRNTSKEKYLEAKKKARGTVYQTRCKAKSKRFVNVMWKDEKRYGVFKIAKRMVKTK